MQVCAISIHCKCPRKSWRLPRPAVEPNQVKVWSHIKGALKTNFLQICMLILRSADFREKIYLLLPFAPVSRAQPPSSDFRAGAASLPITLSHRWEEFWLLFTPTAWGDSTELPARKQPSKILKNLNKQKKKSKTLSCFPYGFLLMLKIN